MSFERIFKLIVNINNIYIRNHHSFRFPILGYTSYNIKNGITEFFKRTAHRLGRQNRKP